MSLLVRPKNSTGKRHRNKEEDPAVCRQGRCLSACGQNEAESSSSENKAVMEVSDSRIKSLVKAVFARHWIDLQKIEYRSIRGTVHVRGELCRLSGRASVRDRSLFEVIESEIKRIPGVKGIHFDVINRC